MNQGQLAFAQRMQHLPLSTLRRCVARYAGAHEVRRFSCLDQYLCMAFAQLTYRESLRDSEACLRAQASKLYRMGLRSSVACNTLANADATRDWRIYCDFAQSSIAIAIEVHTVSAILKSVRVEPKARVVADPGVSIQPGARHAKRVERPGRWRVR
jgi:hypothetical protein